MIVNTLIQSSFRVSECGKQHSSSSLRFGKGIYTSGISSKVRRLSVAYMKSTSSDRFHVCLGRQLFQTSDCELYSSVCLAELCCRGQCKENEDRRQKLKKGGFIITTRVLPNHISYKPPSGYHAVVGVPGKCLKYGETVGTCFGHSTRDCIRLIGIFSLQRMHPDLIGTYFSLTFGYAQNAAIRPMYLVIY